MHLFNKHKSSKTQQNLLNSLPLCQISKSIIICQFPQKNKNVKKVDLQDKGPTEPEVTLISLREPLHRRSPATEGAMAASSSSHASPLLATLAWCWWWWPLCPPSCRNLHKTEKSSKSERKLHKLEKRGK